MPPSATSARQLHAYFVCVLSIYVLIRVVQTANNYQGEESETWIGEWMESRKNRDEMVLATKVCCSTCLS